MRINLPVAVHIFVENGNQVLLLKRANTGFNDGKWSVPAGRLEMGESISQAAIRELMEEVGISASMEDLSVPLFMNHKDERGERIYVFFTVKKWLGVEKNMEIEKCSEIKWFDKTDLPEDLIDHVEIAFEAIAKGKSYIEYGFNS